MPVQPTVVLYTGNGSQTVFTFQFDYISADYVQVHVDGLETAFTFNAEKAIEISPAPTSGAIIRIARVTDRDALVDYTDGSVLVEDDLDLANTQLLHIVQEAIDISQATFTEAADGSLSSGGRRIADVADPVDDQDVVTKSWAEDILGDAQSTSAASAAAAAASAVTAALEAAAAEQSAIDAQIAADAATAGTPASLMDIDSLSKADGQFIVGNGTTWVAAQGAAVLTKLGITATIAQLNKLAGAIFSTDKLHISSTDDVTLSSTEPALLIGTLAGEHIQADRNEVQAFNTPGVVSVYTINGLGGQVNLSASGYETDVKGFMTVREALRASSGSVSSPAVTFTSDLDTGFYSLSADVIAVTLGGSREFRFDAGTSLPSIHSIVNRQSGDTRYRRNAEVFASGSVSPTAGGSVTIPHGLGAVPRNVSYQLVCTTAEHGFSVGDRLTFSGSSSFMDADTGVSIRITSSSIIAQWGLDRLEKVITPGGARDSLTFGRWTATFHAEL